MKRILGVLSVAAILTVATLAQSSSVLAKTDGCKSCCTDKCSDSSCGMSCCQGK